MSTESTVTVPRPYLFGFIIVTVLFSLWGFANDITNPMVAAFKNILLLTNTESSLVQSAFYGGYCLMAIPAAIFIKRFSYKSGILMGLALYAGGCFLFIPAGATQSFYPFLGAYLIMTSGLSFLETTANPYILSMGPEATATRRLNLAQAFNPMGSIAGMFVAKEFILARLDKTDEAGRRALVENDPSAFDKIAQSDLSVLITPYVILGVVVSVFLLIFIVSKLPKTGERAEDGSRVPMDIGGTIRRLVKNKSYVMGVVAQAFYVGAQIMTWTFIIQYAAATMGMPAAEAQGYNIIAMIIFVSSRFICTFFLKYFTPGHLLGGLAIGGIIFTAGAIFLPGMVGLWSLVAVSACMSLMFPTIYGVALEGLGDDAKLGSAGLIMAIGGGCLMPPLQAYMIDQETIMGMMGVRFSFFLPLFCFVVIAIYGFITTHGSSRIARQHLA